MLDTPPDGGGPRDPDRDPASPLGPASHGLTPFLVVDPPDAGASREALNEAVRALLRERDYLREVRDLQLAEHASVMAEQREYNQELQRLFDREQEAWRCELDSLRGELDAVRADREECLAGAQQLEQVVLALRSQSLHYLRLLADQRQRAAAQLREFVEFRARMSTSSTPQPMRSAPAERAGSSVLAGLAARAKERMRLLLDRARTPDRPPL